MTNLPDGPAPPPLDEIAAKIMVANQLGLPFLYMNGFAQGLGAGDVVTILERNGVPIAVLNMSFTAAKTFARATAQSVGTLEELSKRDILTIQEIQGLFTGLSETK